VNSVTAKEGASVSSSDSGEPLQDVVDRLEGEVAELRQSRRRLAGAAHDDRRAFEGALHDGVQQRLVALAADLRHLAGLVDGDPAAAKVLLDGMATNVREAMDEASQLAETIHPPLLEARAASGARIGPSSRVCCEDPRRPEVRVAAPLSGNDT
jgi:signal transduction histidine kinase